MDGVGVALESVRLAERELQRGELVELGGDTFKPLQQAIHFLSYRSSERQHPKVRIFCEWLYRIAQVSGEQDPRTI